MGEVAAEAVELPDDEHVVVPECPQAAVESRPAVAEAGSVVVVEVDLVDAGRPHASHHSAAPAGGALLRRRAPRASGQPPRARDRRGARRGDREPTRMGGSRRPGLQGGRAREHGRVGPVGPRPGRLQPLPALHAAHAAHARHRGVARGPALAESRRRPAQRRHGRPASCGRTRSGAGGYAPRPMPASGRRRCCSTCATPSAPATSGWRGRAATAISGRTLLPVPAVPDADHSLPVPARPRDCLAERQLARADGLRRLAAKAWGRSHVSDRFSPFAAQTIPATRRSRPFLIRPPRCRQHCGTCWPACTRRSERWNSGSQVSMPTSRHGLGRPVSARLQTVPGIGTLTATALVVPQVAIAALLIRPSRRRPAGATRASNRPTPPQADSSPGTITDSRSVT